MTLIEIQKKIAPLLLRGSRSLKGFFKESLLLHLQELNKKIAVFEGKYNKNFTEFKNQWARAKNSEKHSYELESDYMDWEALEDYKRDLMAVFYSL